MEFEPSIFLSKEVSVALGPYPIGGADGCANGTETLAVEGWNGGTFENVVVLAVGCAPVNVFEVTNAEGNTVA